MKILIKSAEIIESGNSGVKKNILIENGVITRVTDQNISADKVIEGKELIVSAGWFDLNASVGDPGLEHKEDIASFSKAAAAGGFTEVVCLPNTSPVIQSKDVIAYIKSRSALELVSVHPIAAVTLGNKGEELAEMIDLHKAGAIAFSDGLNPVWHSDMLLKALQYTGKFGGVVIQRPEDRFLTAYGQMNEGKVSTELGLKGIPALAEEIMIMRDLKILEYTGGHLHFSLLSTPGSLNLIKEAKKRGLQVTCDIASYQLALDDSCLTSFDTNYKVNPPLRDKKQVEALKKGLKEGVIDAVVSAHRPHEIEGKELEFDHADFGMINLQTSFQLLNTFVDLSTLELVNRLCYKPREIVKLPVPEIKEGEKANLTIFERNAESVPEKNKIYSKAKNSPFINKKLKGRVAGVIHNAKYWIND